jgi:hypothetical protein
MLIENGIKAPEMKNFLLIKQENYFYDKMDYYKNNLQ